MKHVIYILLSALALFLAACKKDKKHSPASLEGNWRKIGDSGFRLNWYPDSVNLQMHLSNNRYTHYNKNVATSSGSYEVLDITEQGTSKTITGIRFDGSEAYKVYFSSSNDTITIMPNGGGDMADYYRRIK